MTKENATKVKRALSIYKKALREAEIKDVDDCKLCHRSELNPKGFKIPQSRRECILDRVLSGHKITCIRCEIVVEAEIKYLKALL